MHLIPLLLTLACAGDGEALEQLDMLCAAEPASDACLVLNEDWLRGCSALDD